MNWTLISFGVISGRLGLGLQEEAQFRKGEPVTKGIQGGVSEEDGGPCPKSRMPPAVSALFSALGDGTCRHNELHSLLPRSSQGGNKSGQSGQPPIIGGSISCYAISWTIDDYGHVPHP